ncbi:hypothetical protein LINPERHAP1_LOCUS27907 [Linum perenne]
MMSMLVSSKRRTLKMKMNLYMKLLAQLVVQMCNSRCFEERQHLTLLSKTKFLLVVENLSLTSILKVLFSKPLKEWTLM